MCKISVHFNKNCTRDGQNTTNKTETWFWENSFNGEVLQFINKLISVFIACHRYSTMAQPEFKVPKSFDESYALLSQFVDKVWDLVHNPMKNPVDHDRELRRLIRGRLYYRVRTIFFDFERYDEIVIPNRRFWPQEE